MFFEIRYTSYVSSNTPRLVQLSIQVHIKIPDMLDSNTSQDSHAWPSNAYKNNVIAFTKRDSEGRIVPQLDSNEIRFSVYPEILDLISPF